MIDFATVKPGSTLYIPFDSFAGSTGASITLSGLATSDIEIYKDGSTTQRSSDSGYTLLDTDGIDFDAITGIHGFSINLADNSDAGFYAAGSRYFVVISSVTVDSQTVNFVAASFTIGFPNAVLNTTIATLSSPTSFTLTAGPAEDDALNGMWVVIHDVASAVQEGIAVISDYTGSTKTVTLAAATTYTIAASDNISVMGIMPLQPTVFGRTLDVSSGGEAGLDWANVGSPTTTVTLSGTTVKTATDVETDTQDIQSRLPAALGANGNIKADVRDYNGTAGTFSSGRPEVNTSHIAGSAVSTSSAQIGVNVVNAGGTAWGSGAITAASIASDAITAAKIADGAIDRGTFAADTGLQTIRSNTAQSGTASTITLDASASSTTDFYKGLWVYITGGTGAGQVRLIDTYNGTSKAAAVKGNWVTNPDNTSTFALLTNAGVDVKQFLGDSADVDFLTAMISDGAFSADFSGSTFPNATIADGHLTSAKFGSGAITSTVLADNAITANKIAADAIGASELAADAVAEIADAVWDEAMSGHVTSGTFGQRLFSPRTGTAQAGGGTTITLDASASSTDDIYNYSLIVITGGTGAGQARYITDYVGSTKVATVATWQTNPDNTSVFVIIPGGQIPGATAPTAGEVADAVWDEDIVAAHSTSDTAGLILSQLTKRSVTFSTAVVAGSVVRQLADDGTATFDRTTDSLQAIRDGASAPSAAAIADAVWDESTVGHTTAGTFGEQLKTDVDSILTNTSNIETDTQDIQNRLPAALGANGNIKADVRDFSGTAGTFSSGRPEVNTSHIAGSAVSTSTAQIGVNVIQAAGTNWNSGAIGNDTFGTSTTIKNLDSGSVGSGSTSSTIVLDTTASSTNDFYKGHCVHVISGAGANQVSLITAYNGTSKVATITPSWDVTPVAGNKYVVNPFGHVNVQTWGRTAVNSLVSGRVDSHVGNMATDVITAAAIAADAGTELATAVWASGTRTLTSLAGLTVDTVTSVTNTVNANVTQISGDSIAADNAESFFDGTGYAGTNNVIPTVTSITNTVNANVTQLSGDSVAADNAESFFDGTGYAGTGNTIPTVTSITNTVNANVTQLSGDSTAADNAEAFFDGTGYAATASTIALSSSERNSIATALLDLTDGVESGKTLRQALRLMAAVLAGKRSNSGSATEQFDAIGNPGTARVVGNLNSSGDGTPTLTP